MLKYCFSTVGCTVVKYDPVNHPVLGHSSSSELDSTIYSLVLVQVVMTDPTGEHSFTHYCMIL